MRLSEAIRLGSLAIQNPRKGEVKFCAIGMACAAIGQRRDYLTLFHNWPWTNRIYEGKRFNNWSHPSDGIWSLFDGCVAIHEPTMTLEALCDQVRVWEDELAAKGINVEQVTMVATPEATHEPEAEKSEMVGVTEARDDESV